MSNSNSSLNENVHPYYGRLMQILGLTGGIILLEREARPVQVKYMVL